MNKKMQTAAATTISNVKPLRQQLGVPSSALSSKEKDLAKQAVKVKQRKRPRRQLFFFGVSQTEKIFFIDNLATMLNAGLSLSLALVTLASETKKKTMRKALYAIEHFIDQGRQFSDGLAEHPEVFPPIFIAVVKVGEAGGTLAEVLARLAEVAKKDRALRSKVISALIYPSIVLLTVIGIAILLMTNVFPQIIVIFEEVGVDLPIQTQLLISTYYFFQSYYLYISAAILLIIIVLFFSRRTKFLRRFICGTMLRLPFISNISRELALTRILGNLKMLMISGVPIVQAFTIASKTAGNILFEEELLRIAKKIELGTPLHSVLAQRPRLFPSLTVTMMKVGEETGKIDEILGKLESFYSQRVETIFGNLSTIIEPALLVMMGILVGFIAVSVIMPIYNLAQAF